MTLWGPLQKESLQIPCMKLGYGTHLILDFVMLSEAVQHT